MKFGKNHISTESQYPDNFVKLYAVFQKLKWSNFRNIQFNFLSTLGNGYCKISSKSVQN